MKPSLLEHEYYLIRHAESSSNAQSLIISDPKVGVERYGLTEQGRKQAKDCGRRLCEVLRNKLNSDPQYYYHVQTHVVVLYSPFLRAKQTAEYIYRELIVLSTLSNDRTNNNKLQIVLSQAMEESLQERGFGDLERSNTKNYEQIWECDRTRGPTHTEKNCESVQCVSDRIAALVDRLETQYGDHEHHHNNHSQSKATSEPKQQKQKQKKSDDKDNKNKTNKENNHNDSHNNHNNNKNEKENKDTNKQDKDNKRKKDKYIFLLVTHGDVCQIAQAWFTDVPIHQHRSLPSVQNAEFRYLNNIVSNHRKAHL